MVEPNDFLNDDLRDEVVEDIRSVRSSTVEAAATPATPDAPAALTYAWAQTTRSLSSLRMDGGGRKSHALWVESIGSQPWDICPVSGDTLTLRVTDVPVPGHTLHYISANSLQEPLYGVGARSVRLVRAVPPGCRVADAHGIIAYAPMLLSSREVVAETAQTARQVAPVAPKPSPWTAPELELAIKDYFAMRSEMAVGGTDREAHTDSLLSLLQNRTVDEIDSIRGNVSSALLTQGLAYIDGYQPREDGEALVAPLVFACVDTAPLPSLSAAETSSVVSLRPSTDFDDLDRLVEQPPPPMKNVHEGEVPFRRRVVIDRELVDASNRRLGRAGEEWVVQFERRRLTEREHRPDLAAKVEWVSELGDGDGYDIKSFDGDGQPRRIEVKTTAYAKPTPFYATRNEVARSALEGHRYFLYRVFDFDTNPLRPPPRLFIVPGALADTCVLTPTVFSARVT